MERCFLCGEEYDNDNKQYVISIRNNETGDIAPVRSISYDDKTLALCPRCVRASTFGHLFGRRKFEAVVDVRYEAE